VMETEWRKGRGCGKDDIDQRRKERRALRTRPDDCAKDTRNDNSGSHVTKPMDPRHGSGIRTCVTLKEKT